MQPQVDKMQLENLIQQAKKVVDLRNFTKQKSPAAKLALSGPSDYSDFSKIFLQANEEVFETSEKLTGMLNAGQGHYKRYKHLQSHLEHVSELRDIANAITLDFMVKVGQALENILDELKAKAA